MNKDYSPVVFDGSMENLLVSLYHEVFENYHKDAATYSAHDVNFKDMVIGISDNDLFKNAVLNKAIELNPEIDFTDKRNSLLIRDNMDMIFTDFMTNLKQLVDL